MRCEVMSAIFYDDGELIEEYPFLKDYEYEEIKYTNDYGSEYIRSYITINSLEDLISLMQRSKAIYSNKGLIFDGDTGEFSVQIYDSYVE